MVRNGSSPLIVYTFWRVRRRISGKRVRVCGTSGTWGLHMWRGRERVRERVPTACCAGTCPRLKTASARDQK